MFKTISPNFSFSAVLLFFFLTTLPLAAQLPEVRSALVSYEKENVTAWTTKVPADRKTTQNAFSDWIDERYQINMKGGGWFGNKNIRTAEEVKLPAVANFPVSLIVRTEENPNGTSRMALFALRPGSNGKDITDERAQSALQSIFDSFLTDWLPTYYAEREAAAREKLEDLRETFTDREEAVADNTEEIEALRKENEELRREMEQLRGQIERANATLKERSNARQAVNTSAAADYRR